MENKAKGGNHRGGDNGRDEGGERRRHVGRHGIRHLDLQPLAALQPAVDLHRQNGDKHTEEQATGIGKLAQQHIFHFMHLPVDHHFDGGRRHADKADHRQQTGEQALDAVNPPQLDADKKDRANIEKVKGGVVDRAGNGFQRRQKRERLKAGESIFRIQHHIGDQHRKGADDDHRHQGNKSGFYRHDVAVAVEFRGETPQ